MSKLEMCPTRPDSEDTAETEFCLDPNEHPSDERMAEEGESEVNREWARIKGYVEGREEEKVEEWLDRGIQEVKTEQENVNGSHGELADHAQLERIVAPAPNIKLPFQLPTSGNP